jgi:hypothetical protein
MNPYEVLLGDAQFCLSGEVFSFVFQKNIRVSLWFLVTFVSKFRGRVLISFFSSKNILHRENWNFFFSCFGCFFFLDPMRETQKVCTLVE